MIKNDTELKRARETLSGWEDSVRKMRAALDTDAFQIYKQVHQTQIDEVREEILQYESTKTSAAKPGYFTNFMEVGRWLVRQRIRANLTQKELGTKIRLSQAQVSRAEDSEYQNFPLGRICETAALLGYPFFELGFFRSKREMASFNLQKVQDYVSTDLTSTSDNNVAHKIGLKSWTTIAVVARSPDSRNLEASMLCGV
jgi:transcriptional regulator with XRE-family HTH domain